MEKIKILEYETDTSKIVIIGDKETNGKLFAEGIVIPLNNYKDDNK